MTAPILYIYQHLLVSISFILVTLRGIKWYLIVALIYIHILAHDVDYYSIHGIIMIITLIKHYD
jgi:hypothetical protein